MPSRGRVTVFRAQRSTPVLNRNESRHFPRFLKFGKPSRFPLRSPFLDLMKSLSARSKSRKDSWYTHLEFSPHHATAGSTFLAAFHSLCRSVAEYHLRPASSP